MAAGPPFSVRRGRLETRRRWCVRGSAVLCEEGAAGDAAEAVWPRVRRSL